MTKYLFIMIFLHIVDDFYLQKQGALATLKQKSWWEEQPDYGRQYRYDYKCALIIHSFSWTFMIMLPYTILCGCEPLNDYIYIFAFNMAIHYMTDDMKANDKLMNLATDQLIHLGQIAITYVCLFLR